MVAGFGRYLLDDPRDDTFEDRFSEIFRTADDLLCNLSGLLAAHLHNPVPHAAETTIPNAELVYSGLFETLLHQVEDVVHRQLHHIECELHKIPWIGPALWLANALLCELAEEPAFKAEE